MLNVLTFWVGVLTINDTTREYRENKVVHNPISDFDAYRQDVLAGMHHEQRMKKADAGLYEKKNYPEPHRYIDGSILIENCELYNQDKSIYGAAQAFRWAQQGKYNLKPEELEMEHQRINDEYEKLYRLVRRESYMEKHERIQKAIDEAEKMKIKF